MLNFPFLITKFNHFPNFQIRDGIPHFFVEAFETNHNRCHCVRLGGISGGQATAGGLHVVAVIAHHGWRGGEDGRANPSTFQGGDFN